MARPLDRLAAAIVDIFVLLIPVFILLSAPLKRGLTASFILGAEIDFVGLLIMMIGLGVIVVVAYQALMTYFFGATLGKILFELRVRNIFSDERVGFSACVGRSFVWVCECLCVGLPMLEVFSNPQRRPLHDRMSDTCVISINAANVRSPLSWERGIVRGFFAACALFLFMIGTLQTRHFLEKMKTERGLASLVDHEDNDCDVVTRNISEDEEAPHARLELAMSLYAAGLAERSCLESEIEREMAEQTPAGGITYLAQAFVNADDAEVSNSYLDQVCEDAPGTVECAMSKVVNKWSEEDWAGVEGLLASADHGSGYLEVWAVRHFMKQTRYAEAMMFLDALTDHHELADFSLVQRVKALYNSYREPEAEVALAQALPALQKEDGEELSAWMCAQQLQNSCGALEKMACRGIPVNKDLKEIDFQHASIALSRVMALECQGGDQNFDYLTFSEAVHDEDWQNFFRANLKHQKADNSAAFKLYAEVINSNSSPEILRIEAVRRLAKFASRQQLASVVEMWRSFESKESWMKAGNMLFARFVEKKDRDWAMRIARYLMNQEALSPRALAALTDFSKEPQAERKPASAQPKEDLKLFLDSYEEEQ